MVTRERNRLKTTPRRIIAHCLTLALVAFVLSGTASMKAYAAPTELTLYEGATDTNAYVPFYGFYADAYLKAHMVYSSADLASMNGGTISEMKFYASQTALEWGSASAEVYLKEVESATISAFDDLSGATLVYSGSLCIADGVMTIAFTTPYQYNGGNLLVAVHNVAQGTYSSSSFYGTTVSGASVQNYSYSDINAITAKQRDFLPKVTFTYDFTSTAGGGEFWVEPIDAQIRNAGQMSLALGEAQNVSLEGDFALPYDIMRLLASYPDVTLNYKLTYAGNTYDLAIPGSKVQADASIAWYGPAWLITNFSDAAGQQVAEGQNRTYVVQHGEYVNMIAEKLGVDPKTIIQLNGLKNPNLIHPGQILKY